MSEESPLFRALSDMNELKQLVKLDGAYVDARNSVDKTPLMEAASWGY